MRWESTLQVSEDWAQAVESVRTAIQMEQPDLLFVFVSPHHFDVVEQICAALKKAFPSSKLFGCGGGGVIGGGREVENAPALSVTAAKLPDVECGYRYFEPDSALPTSQQEWQDHMGVDPDLEPIFLIFADPFSSSVNAMVSGLDIAYPKSKKMGGLASGVGAEAPNVLIFDETVQERGAVVVVLYGDIQMEAIVAQGARPVGAPLVVTRCQENHIFELDGRPALRVMQAVYQTMTKEEQELFQRSPMVGLGLDGGREVVSEFLVRGVVGVHRASGMFAAGWPVRNHQTLQFFVRDAASASHELHEKLEEYRQKHGSPAGAVLFSCLGRGASFYGTENHDSELALSVLEVPAVGGFFCSGEIGPVASHTHVHGYTSVFALFQTRQWS